MIVSEFVQHCLSGTMFELDAFGTVHCLYDCIEIFANSL